MKRTDNKVIVVLQHKQGESVELTADRDVIFPASIVRRNGRFYVYAGPYEGNYNKIKFKEINQPVELE